MSVHTAAMHHDMLHTTPQMQAGHHTSSGRPSSAHIKHESHIKSESHIKHELSSPELEQASRGRRRSRDEEGEGGEVGEGSSGDGEGGADGPRKRRRSRKGLDKKFDCPHEKCGKSYSRAEHLYRHQLNHNPKQIYNCEFPGCHRYFVRQDLCARHMERHTAKGSQLQRKDAFLQNVSPTGPPRSASELSQDPSQYGGSPVMQGFPSSDAGMPGNGSPGPRSMYASSPENTMTTISPLSTAAPMSMGFSTAARGGTNAGRGSRGVRLGTSNGTGNPTPPGLNRTESGRSIRWEDTVAGREHSAMSTGAPIATFHDGQRHASFGSSDAMLQDPNIPINRVYAMAPSSKSAGPATPSLGSLSISTMNQSNSNLQQQQQQQQQQHVSGYGDGRTPTVASFPGSPRAFMPQQNVATFSLPPPEYNTPVQTAVSGSSGMDFTTASPQMIATIAQSSLSDANPFDSTTMTYTFPMFGEGAVGDDSSTRSPYAITDNFATWLFNSGYAGSDMAGFAEGMGGFQAPYLGQDLSMNGLYPQQPIPPHRPMAVTSILDTRPESVLSEAKRQELIDVIVNQFNENENAPVIKQKEQLLDGNREDDQHVLSLRMMQRYIISYWDHFHPQLPILHRPSFAADKTPSVLLLAMMMIGATCLERVPTQDVSQAAAQLSQFLAWHLRWAIFSDGAFRPPAKLWIFQALLLLEIYEKMYSTRALHERAHIHHATTITLMRRGSSLIGRSPLDSPPSVKDNQSGQGDGAGGGGVGANNGQSTANNSGSNTPERWWHRWITSEATRRCAFAAFVIDSIHATMFGHSAVMVAHEMRLPLPCDERAWAANDSAEVGRIEASLQADGIKPVTFLEGLKSTLGGQNVRTNSFGRTVLMAGLLSVSYHMHQRDLQVHSLGVSQAVGGREKWRVALLKAFDVWQHHYDGSLAGGSGAPDMSSGPYHYSKQLEDDIIFESRTVLHHLAHMAMHVDIVDCQIFAGASRLLGRSIGPQDFKSACRRMKEWAPRAQARDATFYSLRFLSEVLLPKDPLHAAPSLSEYSARDDCLLNRPWVLYFAALIVWSYGFALEGSIGQSTTLLSSPAERHADMRRFLLRVGGVNTPDDLRDIEGRNGCAGMLMVLRDSFLSTRWELLHEAGNLLGRCLEKLLGTPV